MGNEQGLTVEEQLGIINGLEIEYYDTDIPEDEVVVYIVTVADNKENRGGIKKLGYTDKQIDSFKSYRDNEIDITYFVWAHADWFDGDKFGPK